MPETVRQTVASIGLYLQSYVVTCADIVFISK